MIHHKMLRWLMIVVCLLLLTSCVQIQAPQLQKVVSLFSEQPDPLQDYKWSLTIGDYETHVYFFNVQGQTFFANENKDIIYVNDDSIFRLKVPGIDQATIYLEDTDDESNNIIRRVYVNESLYETQTCQPWVKVTPMNKTQLCQGAQPYQTNVQFDKGNWVHLNQHISYLNMNVILKKL